MQSFRLHDKAILVEIRMGTFQLGSPLIAMWMRIPKKSGIPQMTWLHLVPFLLVVPCKRQWFLEPNNPCTVLVSKQFPTISIPMPIHAIHLGFEKVMMSFGKSTKGHPTNSVEGSRLELMNGILTTLVGGRFVPGENIPVPSPFFRVGCWRLLYFFVIDSFESEDMGLFNFSSRKSRCFFLQVYKLVLCLFFDVFCHSCIKQGFFGFSDIPLYK